MAKTTRQQQAITRALDTTGYDSVQKGVRGDLGLSEILTVPYMWPGEDQTTNYDCNELTSVCPKTGLPDFATVNIEFCPNESIPELKSLKLYFTSYRDVGIFHEHMVMRIRDDFVSAVKPKWAIVKVTMNNRGGINTVCTSTYDPEHCGTCNGSCQE